MRTTEIAIGEGKRTRKLSVVTNKDGFVVGIGGKDGDAWDELDDLVRAGFLARAGTHKGEDVYRVAKVPPKATPVPEAVDALA